MLKRFKLIWFFVKAIFSTNLEQITKIDTEQTAGAKKTLSPAEQLQKFLELYNINAEDKIDYTNTHEDHHSNFKHLDDVNDERFDNVTEQLGLLYDTDGKTPLNAAEVYDMTYEEYETYKETVLPIAKTRAITMTDIDKRLGKELAKKSVS